MKVDALNGYSLNIYYSSIFGNKVLKNSENIKKDIKDNKNKKENFKTYNHNGLNEFENKGDYIDLYV